MRSSGSLLTSVAIVALARRTIRTRAAAILLALFVCSSGLCAQQPTDGDSDHQAIQMLLKRVEQLEVRVAQLEAAKPAVATATGPAEVAGQVTPPAQQTANEPDQSRGMSDRMDTGNTLMRIRGFGDVTFHGDNRKGDTTSFTLGQLNLFVTSDISEKFRLLSEIVFEADDRNAIGVDIERLLLQYSPNDYLRVAAGRYHTAIGYYNTAYHHSTWLQTATGRPFLFEFEDDGGILPIHNVGVSASGLVPGSGKVQLHYVAEVGNGRASRSPLSEPVQNVVDENNTKSVNFGVFATPDAVRGLQLGFSIYHDRLQPAREPRIGETIFAAHAVLVRPTFEWLNEVLDIRHAPDGSPRAFNTPGFYSQISKRFGSYRPYFRYQYVNGSDAEPVFPDVGLRHGPSAGVRFDASESVALKLQYDRTFLRHGDAFNSLALQMGFTF
jgi:hypothetical protein